MWPGAVPDFPGGVEPVVVLWWPLPDDEADEPDPAPVPVPLDFVCPGEDWLVVRPGPEPKACTPLLEGEAATGVAGVELTVEVLWPPPLVPEAGVWPRPGLVGELVRAGAPAVAPAWWVAATGPAAAVAARAAPAVGARVLPEAAAVRLDTGADEPAN